jgi:SagB-type dehydrogenase family enzyme
LRTPATKGGRRAPPAILSARLCSHVTLDVSANGAVTADIEGYALGLGTVSADAAKDVRKLRTGLPLQSFASGRRTIDREIAGVVRRLAVRGLLEYPLARSPKGGDLVVVEPQTPDYSPQTPALGATDTLALSRFAYMRRRAKEMVLESPRARALFRICDPQIANTLTQLSTPQSVKKLRGQAGFPGSEFLALLLDSHILFKVDAAGGEGLRPAEGDESLVLWDFHDLLFHTRSTEGRHANPTGGVYPYAHTIASPPAVRPSWSGQKIGLPKTATAHADAVSAGAKLLRERHSVRDFDDQQPITLAELSQFLDATARVHGTFNTKLDLGGGGGLPFTYAVRPYPSGGASYELELYLAVDKCAGLPRGFYHYDAGEHALTPIAVRDAEFDAQLKGAQFAMDAQGVPQVLITVAARFGRVTWKYSSIAYALILKDVGALLQTLYLMATDMGLGGCAIGSTNIGLFAAMTGLEFHVEGPVGVFALGRGAKTAPASG